MKVSGAKAAEHRSALIATARRLLQEQGFEGAGVAEISREAGLTQGALYSQFKSKDALAAAATREAFADGLAAWDRIRETAPDTLRAYMDAYLSPEHSQDVGGGCLLAACLSDVRRQDPAICDAFGEGFAKLARAGPGIATGGSSGRGGSPAGAGVAFGHGRKCGDGACRRSDKSGTRKGNHRGRPDRA